jgi:hypothetical protein
VPRSDSQESAGAICVLAPPHDQKAKYALESSIAWLVLYKLQDRMAVSSISHAYSWDPRRGTPPWAALCRRRAVPSRRTDAGGAIGPRRPGCWFRRDQAETNERRTRARRRASRGDARTRACALHAQRRRDGQNPATGHAERFAGPGATGHRTEAYAESPQVIGSTGLRQVPAVRAPAAQSHARAALVAHAPAQLTRSTLQYTSSRWPSGLTGAYNITMLWLNVIQIIMFWLNVQPHTARLAADIDRRRGAAKCFLLWCYTGCRPFSSCRTVNAAVPKNVINHGSDGRTSAAA